MEPTSYDQIITKHAELTGLLSKIAGENRAPTDEEKKQLDTLQKDVESIKAAWESEGRKRFLDGLRRPEDPGKVVLTKADSYLSHVKGLFPAEHERLSLGRLLKGYILGNWDGAELEQKVMASSPTTAGGILIPTVLSARIIDRARNLAAVFRAGASTVPMTSNNLKIARVTSDPTADWYSEADTISESDAAFDSVDFTARKMAVLTRINNELLEDADNVDAVLEQAIAAAIALKLDYTALHGSGSAPEPEGVSQNADVNTIPAVGSVADFDDFIAAIFDVRGYNFEPNAAIYSPLTAETLALLKTGISGDKTPLVAPADWAALAKFVTNQADVSTPSGPTQYAFVGQWEHLMIGLRRNIRIEVTREAEDVFKRDQTQIRATWRGDVQLAQPKAFCVLEEITQ